jgi:hypothetical protein
MGGGQYLVTSLDEGDGKHLSDCGFIVNNEDSEAPITI